MCVCVSLSDGVSFYVWIFCMILWFPYDFGSVCVCGCVCFTISRFQIAFISARNEVIFPFLINDNQV